MSRDDNLIKQFVYARFWDKKKYVDNRLYTSRCETKLTVTGIFLANQRKIGPLSALLVNVIPITAVK